MGIIDRSPFACKKKLRLPQCGRPPFANSRGFKIRHEMRDGDDYITFVLESSPERETPLPTYKKKRPSGGNSDLPLFAGVGE